MNIHTTLHTHTHTSTHIPSGLLRMIFLTLLTGSVSLKKVRMSFFLTCLRSDTCGQSRVVVVVHGGHTCVWRMKDSQSIRIYKSKDHTVMCAHTLHTHFTLWARTHSPMRRCTSSWKSSSTSTSSPLVTLLPGWPRFLLMLATVLVNLYGRMCVCVRTQVAYGRLSCAGIR
jgi:hypothetical protein